MGTSHLVQVRPRWDHCHQVQVRPRYIRAYPGRNDAQVRTRVNSPGEAQIWTRVILFQVMPDGDQIHSPGPGEAQVVTGVPGSSRGPGKDQIHQAQVKPKG